MQVNSYCHSVIQFSFDYVVFLQGCDVNLLSSFSSIILKVIFRAIDGVPVA